jgi:hypothetical protein
MSRGLKPPPRGACGKDVCADVSICEAGLRPPAPKPPRDGCGGVRDYWGEFDCSYGTTIACEDCMYGPNAPRGKNPQAKRNQPKGTTR